MKHSALLAALITLTTPAAANAPRSPTYWASAGHLAIACADEAHAPWCRGFLVATEDALVAVAGREIWCAPEGTTLDTYRLVYLRWLAVHPDAKDEPAVKMLTVSLVEEWPCKAKAPAQLPPGAKAASL